MAFEEIDYTIKKCENLLSIDDMGDPEIEIFLTSYLLLITYSNFENNIRNSVISYLCKKYDDINLENYINYCTERIVRSIKIGDIAGLLGYINPKLKEKFTNYQKNNQKIVSSYDSIINNRHNVAHKNGTKLTMKDFLDYYNDAQKLFIELDSILNHS